MLDPEDNLENQANQGEQEKNEPLQQHLHKPISSIFGQQPSLELKPGIPKETAKPIRYNPGSAAGKAILIFKLLLLVSLVLILFFYYRGQKEASRRTEIEGKLVQVDAEAKALQASLDAMKETVSASEKIKAEFELLKKHSLELNTNLETIFKEKTNLEKTLQENEKKLQELTNQLAALKSTKIDLEGKLTSSRESSSPQGRSLKKIVSVDAAKRSGKILVVKPASNIAVVNLGSKDGIEAGSVFEIYNANNNYVAQLIVDEVEDTISIGKISPETESRKVRENDIAQEK